MVLRLIPQTILTLEQLKLPAILKELAARPKGLILVTAHGIREEHDLGGDDRLDQSQ